MRQQKAAPQVPCYRCPSSGVFLPRVMLRSRATAMRHSDAMRYIYDLPVCPEHCTPFPEAIHRAVARHSLSNWPQQAEDVFVHHYGILPDKTLTVLDYVAEDHPDVLRWRQKVADRKALLPPHEQQNPIVVQHVTHEELAHIMASAPDVAMPFGPLQGG